MPIRERRAPPPTPKRSTAPPPRPRTPPPPPHRPSGPPPRRPAAAALPVHREARVRVDLPPPRVEAHVEVEPGVAALDLERVAVVVVAVLDAVDQLGHDMPDDRR